METDKQTLAYWKEQAKQEITRWLGDREYQDKISRETLKDEYLGPFTKFLYHFAHQCQEAGWGVMVDFNERSQKIYLTDRYYKWMHKLRDEIIEQLEKLEDK